MTISALRALQDEAQPDVARPPAPRLPHRTDHRPPTPAPAPADPAAGAPTGPVRDLLTWAAAHPDPTVQARGEQAATALRELTIRRDADAELEKVTSEAAELEQRLAALRAREAELRPPAPAKGRRKAPAARDYDPAVVRAWAREQGKDIPPVGRVPKDLVDEWRQHTATHPGPVQPS